MATTPLQPIVTAIDLTTSYVDIYTVPTSKVGIGIDAVVLNNYTTTKQNYSIRLVQAGEGTILNEIITKEEVRAENNNLAVAMIGQGLKTGGVIQAKASEIESISITITATIIDS